MRPHKPTQVLLKGIFEATEVNTPTTFIILDEEQNQELKENSTCDAKVVKGLNKVRTWLERLQVISEGVIQQGESDKLRADKFFKIKDALGDLVTKDKMYFSLVDELTGEPVQAKNYPIVITRPLEIVHKLLPVMLVGMRAMSLCNGVLGVARMFGAPVPYVTEEWRKGAQDLVDVLKQVRFVIEPNLEHHTC